MEKNKKTCPFQTNKAFGYRSIKVSTPSKTLLFLSIHNNKNLAWGIARKTLNLTLLPKKTFPRN